MLVIRRDNHCEILPSPSSSDGFIVTFSSGAHHKVLPNERERDIHSLDASVTFLSLSVSTFCVIIIIIIIITIIIITITITILFSVWHNRGYGNSNQTSGDFIA